MNGELGALLGFPSLDSQRPTNPHCHVWGRGGVSQTPCWAAGERHSGTARAAQGLLGPRALPPPQGRKQGREMGQLTHPSSLLPHSPALGLWRGVLWELQTSRLQEGAGRW